MAVAWLAAAARERDTTDAELATADSPTPDPTETASLELALANLPDSISKAAALLRCGLADLAADGIGEDDHRGVILATLALEALQALQRA